MKPLIYWKPTWLRRIVLVSVIFPALIISAIIGGYKGAADYIAEVFDSIKPVWRGKI